MSGQPAHSTCGLRHGIRLPVACCFPTGGPSAWHAVAAWAVLSMVAVAAFPAVIHGLTEIEPQRRLPGVGSHGAILHRRTRSRPERPDQSPAGRGRPVCCREGSGGHRNGTDRDGRADQVLTAPALGNRRGPPEVREHWIGMVLTFAFGLGILVAAVGWNDAVDGIGKQADCSAAGTAPAASSSAGPTCGRTTRVSRWCWCGFMEGRSRLPTPAASTRLPLQTILAIWYGSVAALAGAWLFALVPAGRVPPERGWLAMLALTSIVMLVSTPICWSHYFLWTMPACALPAAPSQTVDHAGAALWVSPRCRRRVRWDAT